MSKTSTTDSNPVTEWTGPRVNHADFVARLVARRAKLGNPELPRNSSKNRTPSKIALLKAIEEAGGKW